MRLYLREQGEFLDEYSALERAWLAVYFVQVSKLQLFCGPRKSPLNIETRILLISEKSRVRPLVPQKLISSYLWVYISVKRRNSGRNDSV